MINMKFVTDVIVIAVLAFFAYIIVSLLIRDARNKKLELEFLLMELIQQVSSLMFPVGLVEIQGLLTSR